MDGNGQITPHKQQQQQQQQPSAWYGGPHQYHLPPPPQPMQWQYSHDRPPSYSQQPPLPPMYHHQPDFYSQPQQQQHYSAPPNQQQHLQPPQHGQFYAQQNQGWPSSNGWNNQFSYHGPVVGLGQEEDWAAKARAWATAKAAQEAAQQAQFQPQAMPNMEQPYQDSLPKVDPLQSSLQPPGQEVSLTYNHAEANASYNQDTPSSYAPSSNSNFMQDVTSTIVKEDVPLLSFVQNLTSSRAQPLSHPQLVGSSSFSEDVSSSYGLETLPTGPANQELQNQRQLSPQQASVPQLAQQHQKQSHIPLLASSGSQQQQHSTYPEPPAHYEFNSQQQFEFQQHQSQEFQQQPPSQYMPPSMAMDAPDMGYGGPALSVQVWPSIGGPSMPFVPNMGPGLNGAPLPSQFEQHNHPHLQAAHQMHGSQSPHMFARPLGPPHGPGFQPGGPPLGAPYGFGGSPSLGPGPGAGIQSLFMTDGNGHLGGPDRPKKAAVPSWLREELLKKRAAAALGGLTSSAYPDELVQANGDEASVTPIRKASRKTESSGLSDSEEEEDEDEVEAARTTAINQEIKRVLTEVLLKVTDSLFDEIAQEVLEEEEETEEDRVPLQAQDLQADSAYQGKRSVSAEPVGQGSLVRAAASPPPPDAPTLFAPTRVLVAPAKKAEQSGKEDSESLTSNTPAGNVLGLANYASDDENDVQSGRETSVMKFEKHVEDAKDGRLSKVRVVDEASDKKQEKVIETQHSVKEMERTSGKEIGEESENRHKFERNKGRESDREREDRKEDRKEKDKERGRERERKENKERNEQKQWKERKKVNEVSNPHEQDGKSLRKAQPVEAEKSAATGQSEARGVEDTEFISRQSKIRSSHSRTVELRAQKHLHSVGDASGDQSLEPQDPSGHAESFVPTSTRSSHSTVEPQGKGMTEVRIDQHNRGDRVRSADANTLDKFLKEGKEDIPEKGTMNSEKVFEKVSSLSDHTKTHGSRTEELEKLDKMRVREKAGGKPREKENEKLHEKDKSKQENRVSDIGKGKDKDKSKDKKIQEADRRHNERGRADVSREKKHESRDTKRSRRRSTSASGRGRSRSRSTSSRSLSSSLSPSRDGSPKRRKLHVRRSSRRRSISRSPIRSRRRSRSRSRSPRSKHSHRRVSPSPSRERDRHKRSSRSGSPVRRRRRS